MRSAPNTPRANRDAAYLRLAGIAPMVIRSFVDSRGVSWRVRASIPVVSQFFQVNVGRDSLTFSCAGERRSLTPIPTNWLTAAPSVLEEYCGAANRIPIRRAWLD